MINTPTIERGRLIESLFSIDNKRGIVVPFRWNRMQRHFHTNKGNRNIVLKHRQGGMTSSILNDHLLDCLTVPNTYCATISHEGEATKRLFNRTHFFYDTMDEPKPKTGADSRTEITFPELHSTAYIGTAGARAFGRGDTIRKALLSELAFYEDPDKIFNAVEDAVPMEGELTIECTPNGEDNLLFDLWTRAREGKSPYKPFFYPWWWTSEYNMPRGCEHALKGDRGELTYTAEELELIAKAHLTEAQIRWRRWKISIKQGLFWQEFPEDEISCFISIGDPVFDASIITRMSNECYKGDVHPEGWLYWRKPDPNNLYTVAADSAAGAPGGSYSAAVVLDAQWNVVATYQARVEPHVFAGILKKMGLCYNTAEIAVERNFTGYAVLGHMLEYPKIYMQRDFTTGKITSNRGWWTNEQTRQFMITAAKDHLAQLHIFDLNLIRQLKGYRWIKHKATPQTFDDLAISLMIAVAVRKVQGTSRGFQGASKGWSW